MTESSSAPSFEPIAIVGQACVLPGALSPDELWNSVLRGDDLLGNASAAEWRADPARFLDAAAKDKVATLRAGYIDNFAAVFKAERYAVPADELNRLDPLVQWTLHVADEALLSAGLAERVRAFKAGLVLGNLSYPSQSLSSMVEAFYFDAQRDRFPDDMKGDLAPAEPVAPINRFMSGWPAMYVSRVLGLSEGGFALDAACASSLYAIKIACDRLHDHCADVMLACGVNAADSLLLQVGFTALNAISPSGNSRPFHGDADGLIPSKGAACVVLRRLADALNDGNPILGLIRGVGTSNDGRARGLLAPSSIGQVRAMRDAYAMAGVDPKQVSLIECHATGTLLGDATEIASMREVFCNAERVATGSIKGNIGHPVTVAGLAGLLKILAAMKHGVLPPTRPIDKPIEGLSDSPFELIEKPQEWASEGPRLAALNAFGFGGNNAHVLVEEWRPSLRRATLKADLTGRPAKREPIVVVGVGASVAGASTREAFTRALFGGHTLVRTREDGFSGGYMDAVELPLEGLRFPPHDLAEALPQQWLMLNVAIEAVTDAGTIPSERTGVFVGMQCDPAAGPVHLRWRLPEWIEPLERVANAAVDADWIHAAQDALSPPMTAATVLGHMPNIPANRINAYFDFRGRSHSVSAEEASGIVALELAIRALHAGELDSAVVGAVDLSCDPVHGVALAACTNAAHVVAGDAAVALVLKRLSDAQRDGNRIYGVVSTDEAPATTMQWSDKKATPDFVSQFGHAHAASGLLQLTAALLACRHHVLPQGPAQAAIPWVSAANDRAIAVHTNALGGMQINAWVGQYGVDAAVGVLTEPMPEIHHYAAESRAALWEAMCHGHESVIGTHRLAIVAASDDELQLRLALAKQQLGSGKTTNSLRFGEGVFYRDTPLHGEIGFIYTMAAACYPGMGQPLMNGFPDLASAAAQRLRHASEPLQATPQEEGEHDLLEQLRRYSFICHAHTALSTAILGLMPSAAIGLCTGESSALFCLGAWSDAEKVFDEADAIGLYTRELAGDFVAVRKAWNLAANDDAVNWATWRALAPIEQVCEALRTEPRAHLAIMHTANDCLIVGDAAACERVTTMIGHGRARRIGSGMAIHCPEVAPFSTQWRTLHRRPTHDVPGIRFYSQALGAAYVPDADAAAELLTAQALQTVDFPRVINQAWSDGVRVFIEHGPRGLCSGWIRDILGDRDHVAINLDSAHCSGIRQLYNVIAQLWVAGVPVRDKELIDRLHQCVHAGVLDPARGQGKKVITLPAHRSLVAFPPLSARFGCDVAQAKQARRSEYPAAGEAVATRTSKKGAPSMNKKTPLFSREQLEVLASGSIASVFGPMFNQQEMYLRQVRMPMPPLLLADRVMRIDAVPGRLEKGSMLTETDVRADAWYMHRGHMPAGLMIEAGQADLLLISWMGIDFRNKGQRVYRLLGCKLTFHGGLPRPGETLAYEIKIDGHARHDDVDLFFFHYDCYVAGTRRITAIGGQAGFFTDEELANSKGVWWDAATADFNQSAVVAGPRVVPVHKAFSSSQVHAFTQGRLYECFGQGFEISQTQVDPPCIPDRQLQLFDRVTHLETTGGPWGRGYLRAELDITPNSWFFQGHFLNDPCMPGTLMFEGCLQTMAFYLSALGYSLDKDGWCFEPVTDEAFELICRGQVTPNSARLVYEMFVEELHSEPIPTLHAALLCSVDGLKAFHCRRMGYQLTAGWPLQNHPEWLLKHPTGKPDIERSFPFDYGTLLTAAWGKPSAAFGARYGIFDASRICSRIPGPPYLCISRIVAVGGDLSTVAGASIIAEYDIPHDAWYFAESVSRDVPFCIVLEAALQPCGLLALGLGCPLLSAEDLKFRNLDGHGVVHATVHAADRTLRTCATLTSISQASGMIIVSFDVECFVGQRSIYTLKTVFGYFPAAAFVNQAGLSAPLGSDTSASQPNNVRIELKHRPARYFTGPLRLPGASLLMIDRVVGVWPSGGSAGLGFLRAEKDIDPSLWFFKAHFYQDPVQPGSLGLEAMLQLLQFYLLHENLADGVSAPQFQPIMVEHAMAWKYRGQVSPEHRLIRIDLEITQRGHDAQGPFVVANAWLFVDGVRIYEAMDIGLRIVGDSLAVMGEKA